MQKRGAGAPRAGAEGPRESGWPHEKGPHVGEAPCLVYRAHSFPVTRRKVYARLPPDRLRYFQAAVFNSVSFTVAFNVLTFKVGFHLDRNPAFRRLTGRYGREHNFPKPALAEDVFMCQFIYQDRNNVEKMLQKIF